MKNKKTYIIITAAVCAVLLILGAVYFIARKSDADENSVTRFEWMEMLGEQFGINEYTTQAPYFQDVNSANPYFAYVQAAAEWGIVDTKLVFDGEKYATVQFVALTAMRTIGETKLQIYFGTDDPITEDAYIEFASTHGLIAKEQLNARLSREECEHVLEIVRSLNFGELWKDDYSKVVYQSDVVELSTADILQSNDDGSEIVVAGDRASSFEVGTVIVFEQEHTKLKLAREITAVSPDGTLSLSPAQIDQVVESVTVSDITEVTFEDIVNYYGPDENTDAVNTLMYRQTDASLIDAKVFSDRIASKGYKISVSTKGEGSEKQLEIKITDNATKVSKKFSISEKVDPDSEYSVEVDIDKIYIGGQVIYTVRNGLEYAEAAVDAHATFKGSLQMDEDKKIPLFETPAPLGNGIVGADIQVYLVLSVEGGISFEAELPIEASVAYEKNRGLRKTQNNISVENPMVEVNCEAGAMLRFEPMFVVLGCLNVMDAEADIGVKASAKTTARSDSQICADISVAFPVFTLSVCGDDDADTLIGNMGLSAEWEIISSDNAPIKKGFHYELLSDGTAQFVEKCTYGQQKEAASADIQKKSPVESKSSESGSPEFAKYSTYELPIQLWINTPFEDSGEYYTVRGNLGMNYSVYSFEFNKLSAGDSFVIWDKQFVRGKMLRAEDYPDPNEYQPYTYSVYCAEDDRTYYINTAVWDNTGSRYRLAYFDVLTSVPGDATEMWERLWSDLGEHEFKIAKDAHIISSSEFNGIQYPARESNTEEEWRMWLEEDRRDILERYAYTAEECYDNHIAIDGWCYLTTLTSEYGVLDEMACYVTFDDNGVIDSIVVNSVF